MQSNGTRKAGAGVRLCARHHAQALSALARPGLDKKAGMKGLIAALLLTKDAHKPVLNNRARKPSRRLRCASGMLAGDLAPQTGPRRLRSRLAARICELFANTPCPTTPSAQRRPFQMTWNGNPSACPALHAAADRDRTWAKSTGCSCIRGASVYAISWCFISRAGHGYPQCLFGWLELGQGNTRVRRLGHGLWDGQARGWCCGGHLPHRCPHRGRRPPGMARRARAAKICVATHGLGVGTATGKIGGGHGA